MSSLSAKDRVSLCSFTFSDGRRCRAPLAQNHPRFCFYHAQKEARARAAETLGKDLAYFFSGDYLSACDLSTALARLIPAVVRGDVKPKTAHTLAYLVQTLAQAIHISQHEYINAFGTDGWRKSVRNSVKGNFDYRFPPEPEKPESPQPLPQPAAQPQTQAQQPASAPPTDPPQPAPVAHPPVAHPLRGEAFPSASPLNPQHTQSPPHNRPSRQPNPLGRLCQLPSQTTYRRLVHLLRNLPQTGTPTPSTSTTTAACSQTANPFRINTYNPARNC